MKYDKIVLAGGNGYLGQVLQDYYKPLTRELIVLSRKPAPQTENIKRDGAFPRLLTLARLGAGGKLGNGQQYVSWIHEQDAAKCTEWLLQHESVSGVFNCTSPKPVKNEALMAAIRKACGIPFGVPSPAWLLEIGAQIIGTETELLLKSRWVLPKRLLDNQFEFSYPEVEHAINDIVWQP